MEGFSILAEREYRKQQIAEVQSILERIIADYDWDSNGESNEVVEEAKQWLLQSTTPEWRPVPEKPKTGYRSRPNHKRKGKP